ncbi:hypothetical protein MBANPS3_000377 [Mucor bainieri]
MLARRVPESDVALEKFVVFTFDELILGFVGLSAGYSWAGKAHLPGLRLIQDSPYKITAIVNSTLQAAEASKEKNKLQDAQTFGSIQDLLSQGDVDTVVVSVKVPHHYEYVHAALEAGKDVVCEWPLGNGSQEAEELNNLAKSKNVKAGVVLQARKAPSIIKAKELVESGAIGKIVSTNFSEYTDKWSQYTDEHFPEYLNQRKNGANLLAIPVGHDLDALAFVLGEFEFLSGIVKTHFKDTQVTHADPDGKKTLTGETALKDTPDQVLVQGLLQSGAVASVHIQGLQSSELTQEKGFLWEIRGSKGDILLSSKSLYSELEEVSIQISRLDDEGNALPVEDLSVEYDPVAGNLKTYYEDFAKTKNSQYAQPQQNKFTGFTTFDDAVIRHRQIEAILRSSKSGKRETYI